MVEPERDAAKNVALCPLRGDSPAARVEAASTGSMTRSPDITRRMAEARTSAGASFTTKRLRRLSSLGVDSRRVRGCEDDDPAGGYLGAEYGRGR